MKKGYKKCLSCEKIFDAEAFGFSTDKGKAGTICDDCYSNDCEEPEATIVFVKDSERETTYVGGYTIQGEYADEQPVWDYARSIKWKGIGYRGYYEGKAPAGFVQVEDSWFCGFDGANIDGDLALFQKKFDKDQENPPFDLLVGFPRTSNIFSTGIEIYVRKENIDDFKAWIAG